MSQKILIGVFLGILVGIGGNFLWAKSYSQTKRELKQTKKKLGYYNRELGRLEKQMEQKIKNINWLGSRLKSLERQINRLTVQLKNSHQKIQKWEQEQKNIQLTLSKVEEELIQFLSKFYYITNQQVESLPDLINGEIYHQLEDIYAKKVAILVNHKKFLQGEIEKLNRKINAILAKQKLLKRQKRKYGALQKRREKELDSLKRKQKEYWNKIQQLKKQQVRLQQFLERLKIIRQGGGQAVKLPKQIAGLRFVAPVKGEVVQRFGSYVDPIYKIRIYNNSVKLKTPPYAKVRAIERGIVVYAGEHDGKKMVFVKHPSGVFSIYSGLYVVAPGVKKGVKVGRGQVIARVKGNLEFAMSYREKYVNPLRLISFGR